MRASRLFLLNLLMTKITLSLLAALASTPFCMAQSVQPSADLNKPQATNSSAAEALDATTRSIISRCQASTVGLCSHKNGATSSGVIISKEGLILSAGHIVGKPGTIFTVRLIDGSIVEAISLGTERSTDAAVMRITSPAPAGGWPFSPIAPAYSALVGEWVIAAGNPGGIIIDRPAPLRLGRVTRHEKYLLQTDCTVMPGDSGGPIFDLKGRVVGIVSNIQFNIQENYSVPVSVFHDKWQDFLAGKEIRSHDGMMVDLPTSSDQGADNDYSRLQEALQKLTAQGDPEAIKLMKDAKAANGKLNISSDLATKFLRRAKLPPRQGGKQITLIHTALSVLAKFGHKQAQELLLQASSKGKLALSPQEMSKYIHDANQLVAKNPAARAAAFPVRQKPRLGETSSQALSYFTFALKSAGSCSVDILDNNTPILKGTVVDADGWIVTKASDLCANPKIQLTDGTILEAMIIGKDAATDLALLKVEANNLTPVKFADKAALGSWLVAPVRDVKRPSIGLVSVAERPIGKAFPMFRGVNQSKMGLAPRDKNSRVVATVIPDFPADKAGILVGDELLELNGHPVTTWESFSSKIKASKPGDILKVKLQRKDKKLIKSVIMRPHAHIEQGQTGGGTDLSGGKLSKRQMDFPSVIQHDAVVWADECGGPLFNINGETIGINIARHDRTCTYALPSDLVKKTIAKLRSNAQ